MSGADVTPRPVLSVPTTTQALETLRRVAPRFGYAGPEALVRHLVTRFLIEEERREPAPPVAARPAERARRAGWRGIVPLPTPETPAES